MEDITRREFGRRIASAVGILALGAIPADEEVDKPREDVAVATREALENPIEIDLFVDETIPIPIFEVLNFPAEKAQKDVPAMDDDDDEMKNFSKFCGDRFSEMFSPTDKSLGDVPSLRRRLKEFIEVLKGFDPRVEGAWNVFSSGLQSKKRGNFTRIQMFVDEINQYIVDNGFYIHCSVFENSLYFEIFKISDTGKVRVSKPDGKTDVDYISLGELLISAGGAYCTGDGLFDGGAGSRGRVILFEDNIKRTTQAIPQTLNTSAEEKQKFKASFRKGVILHEATHGELAQGVGASMVNLNKNVRYDVPVKYNLGEQAVQNSFLLHPNAFGELAAMGIEFANAESKCFLANCIKWKEDQLFGYELAVKFMRLSVISLIRDPQLKNKLVRQIMAGQQPDLKALEKYVLSDSFELKDVRRAGEIMYRLAIQYHQRVQAGEIGPTSI